MSCIQRFPPNTEALRPDSDRRGERRQLGLVSDVKDGLPPSCTRRVLNTSDGFTHLALFAQFVICLGHIVQLSPGGDE